MIKGFLVISGLLVPFGIMAHPGHGTFTGTEISHYFTSPIHIGVGVALIVLAIILIRKRITKGA